MLGDSEGRMCILLENIRGQSQRVNLHTTPDTLLLRTCANSLPKALPARSSWPLRQTLQMLRAVFWEAGGDPQGKQHFGTLCQRKKLRTRGPGHTAPHPGGAPVPRSHVTCGRACAHILHGLTPEIQTEMLKLIYKA